MGVIRQLKNFFTGKIIYPKTLTKAVYDENGERLDKILRDTMLAVDSEEYNGVEPRDADTLGGKYKADDITAIKEKVNEINSSLTNYTGYGEVVALDNVTSESNQFTVPTNGVLYLKVEGNNAYIYANIGTFVVGASSNWENGVNSVVVPVFKGMKIYETIKLGNNSSISFIPFKK